MMIDTYGYGMMGWFGAHGLFLLFWAAVIVVPFWKIFGRLGFSGWLSLLMLIPPINLVVLYIVAFSRWPRPNQIDGPQP